MASGLPEMTSAERVSAELEVLGLDVSRHVVDFYVADARLPRRRRDGRRASRDLLRQRSRSEVFVAGVKVATQTPPVRSGRRVVFLTLDDSTGPVDATFFEDAQGPYAATVFASWLLLVRGEVRRTGPRGVSIRATGCWELGEVRRAWLADGVAGVAALVNAEVEGAHGAGAAPGARPRQRVPAVAVRRHQAGRAGRRSPRRRKLLALQSGQQRMVGADRRRMRAMEQ